LPWLIAISLVFFGVEIEESATLSQRDSGKAKMIRGMQLKAIVGDGTKYVAEIRASVGLLGTFSTLAHLKFKGTVLAKTKYLCLRRGDVEKKVNI